jgi:lipoprotein NlpD
MRGPVPARLLPLCCLRLLLLTLVLATAGCGSNAPAPVEDRGARTPAPVPPSHSSVDTYTVQRGDTLYSIAFRYGLDFRRVAAANRIAAPYTIYVGQKIALKEGDLPAPRATTPSPGSPGPVVQPRPAPPAA